MSNNAIIDEQYGFILCYGIFKVRVDDFLFDNHEVVSDVPQSSDIESLIFMVCITVLTVKKYIC